MPKIIRFARAGHALGFLPLDAAGRFVGPGDPDGPLARAVVVPGHRALRGDGSMSGCRRDAEHRRALPREGGAA